jgi:tRNA pseudouridine55 synthase
VARRPDADVPPSVLLVDKPAGLTSHDVVARARRLLSVRRIGHAGTLDPMATGLLVLGVGSATRLLGHLAGHDKTYEATIRLGQATVTDDREGEVVSTASTAGLDDAAVRAALAAQTGPLQQVPSSVSAVKVAGRRSYDRVRAGEEVELAPRAVTVHSLDVHRIARPVADLVDVDVTVRCTAGTYIRAIARDAGAALGVGGHLTALRRTASGPFGVDRAASVEDAAAAVGGGGPGVLGLTEAATAVFPRRDLTDAEAVALGFGQRIPASEVAGLAAAVAPDGRLVALVEDAGRWARVSVGFPAPTPAPPGGAPSSP